MPPNKSYGRHESKKAIQLPSSIENIPPIWHSLLAAFLAQKTVSFAWRNRFSVGWYFWHDLGMISWHLSDQFLADCIDGDFGRLWTMLILDLPGLSSILDNHCFLFLLPGRNEQRVNYFFKRCERVWKLNWKQSQNYFMFTHIKLKQILLSI